MKEYPHPIDGKPVIEFSLEDWEAGRMAGVWLPAISCEDLPQSDWHLRPHPTTQEPTYFYLPLNESLRIDEAKKSVFHTYISRSFEALKGGFHHKFSKSRNRIELLTDEINRVEGLWKPDRHKQAQRTAHPDSDPTYYFPEDYKRYFVNGGVYPFDLIEHPSLNLPAHNKIKRAFLLEAHHEFLRYLETLLKTEQEQVNVSTAKPPKAQRSSEAAEVGEAMSYTELALLLSYERVSVSNKAEAVEQFTRYPTKREDPNQLIPKAHKYYDPSARLCHDVTGLELLGSDNNSKAVLGRLRLLKNIEPFITETGRKAYETDIQTLRNYIEKQKRRTF